ncbi:hypothetical protein RintRC_0489 [Richelia intracellularis]|nr:hypothetical protein RintRC_0489 [Richelia intracellularis]
MVSDSTLQNTCIPCPGYRGQPRYTLYTNKSIGGKKVEKKLLISIHG